MWFNWMETGEEEMVFNSTREMEASTLRALPQQETKRNKNPLFRHFVVSS